MMFSALDIRQKRCKFFEIFNPKPIFCQFSSHFPRIVECLQMAVYIRRVARCGLL